MSACDLCGHTNASMFAEKFALNYLRCDECGHVYADVSEFDYVAHNEEANAELEGTHNAKFESDRHIRNYEARLREFAGYRNTNRLVEVGCSSGAFLKRAALSGWDAVGIEPVAESARLGIEEHGLDIKVGTLQDADFAPDSIDVVYSNAVIEHVDSPTAIINEAARILRPGGLFYADTVNIASYTWRFLGTRWKLVDPRVHLHLFSPDSLAQMCNSAGLHVQKMTTHGVRFYATREEQPTGFARIVDELHKAPYSFAARRNLKGDNIAIYACKAAARSA